MNEEKIQLQKQVSELIHQDVVNIITNYSENFILDLNLMITFIQDINLLKAYDVKYLHNNELNEVIDVIKIELKDLNTARAVALLASFEFLQNPQIEFKKLIYINLSLRVPSSEFLETFSFFNVLVSNVKELFDDFVKYIFNDSFLSLDENIQIDTIYKIWNFSQQLFHDNEASQYAYTKLKVLFDKALELEKTEVAFWLYYTPLHYYNSGTNNDIDEANEKFKNEIEKPLEKYIQTKIMPKYNITPNNRKIDKNKRIKVAFVIQRIVGLSTINIFYSLIKSLSESLYSAYEFILYDLSFAELGGSDIIYVEKFKKLGIKYVNLHERIFGNIHPTYSLLEKSIKTREILIEDDIDIFIGLHTRVEYIFLYATRTSPKQVYWYHNSNAQYDIEGIDRRITHCGIPKESRFEMKIFTVTEDYISDEDFEFEKEAKEIRNKLFKDCVILGSIGRLIKIDNEEYLNTVLKIMQENPKTIYLACGEGDKSNIFSFVKKNGLEERFYLPGFINSKVYGRVIDIYLNTFPDPGGESINEFRALGEDKFVVSLIN